MMVQCAENTGLLTIIPTVEEVLDDHRLPTHQLLELGGVGFTCRAMYSPNWPGGPPGAD